MNDCISLAIYTGNRYLVSTYSVLFPDVETMLKHSLLGVHLLEIARWVAMHLDAVWRGRDPSLRTVYLVIMTLGECRRAGLAVWCNVVEFEEVIPRMWHVALLLVRASPAIAMLLTYLGAIVLAL